MVGPAADVGLHRQRLEADAANWRSAFPAAAMNSTTAKRMAKALAWVELLPGCSPGTADVGLARQRLAGAGCLVGGVGKRRYVLKLSSRDLSEAR